jgi:hypothetical protein
MMYFAGFGLVAFVLAFIGGLLNGYALGYRAASRHVSPFNVKSLRRWMIILLFAWICTESRANAQSLTMKIFIGAAAFDVTTTAHNMAIGGVETNPAYSPIRNQPISVTLLLSAQYAGEWWIARKLTPHHPKIAKTILLLSSAEAIRCGAYNVSQWRPPAFIAGAR